MYGSFVDDWKTPDEYISNQVRELVAVELESANRQFPQFHSPHEGWAVILEEYEELEDECENIHKEMLEMFRNIRTNDKCYADCALSILLSAVYAACEAIQVAAMAEKLLNMEETR